MSKRARRRRRASDASAAPFDQGATGPRGAAPSAVPEPGARRVRLFRVVLLLSTFFGLLASHRLWLTERDFPTIPVGGLPVLPPPWDRVLFGAVLVCLLIGLRFYRAGVLAFLAGAVLLVLFDQNRLQPWFYLYAVLLFLSLFPERPAVAGWRVALSAVYLWSGIQKLNPAFFEEVVPWFVAPAAEWLGEAASTPVRWLIAAAGPIEILIGAGVWSRKWRRFAILSAVLVHAGVLLLLGPLGRDYNRVVWPWNIGMPLLLLLLFPIEKKALRPLAALRESPVALAAVSAFSLLPALSYTGVWDSYLSFCVYSGNTARAHLEVSPALRDRLPGSIRRFVVPARRNTLRVDVMRWALAELGTPPLAEPRGFQEMARYVARFAPGARDVALIVAPRPGRYVVYEQSELLRE